MIKYKMTLGIGLSGATQDDVVCVSEMGYSDEEWEKLTEDRKDDELMVFWEEWSREYIDGGWERIES